MKHSIFSGIAAILAASLLTGCAAPAAPATAPATVPSPTEPSLPAVSSVPTEPSVLPSTVPDPTCIAQELLDSLSLREKVGQLFIVRPDALEPAISPDDAGSASFPGVTALSDTMSQFLRDYPVGGVVMFHKNLVDPQQLTVFNQALLHAGSIPMFLAVDEEGGSVARIANHAAFDVPRYRSAKAVGGAGDPSRAWEMGNTIGNYLKLYGFNMDFAPVADVDTNPDNPVIGNRAFSSDANTVAVLARAAANGLHDAGIIPVFKHFPGHGDTAQDSHLGIAVAEKSREELDACEWIPFRQAGPRDCIMVGHVAVPDLTGDLTPATMSAQLVTGILREELAFDGLVITDSLSMGAITNTYSSADAALLALQAGCDLLLMPYDLPSAFDAVVSAVTEGTLSEETLDKTVCRILSFKLDSGLMD